jgi:hypothetical protein
MLTDANQYALLPKISVSHLHIFEGEAFLAKRIKVQVIDSSRETFHERKRNFGKRCFGQEVFTY